MEAIPANSTRARLRRFLADPVGVLRRRLAPGSPATPDPFLEILRNYGAISRASGVDRLYLFLSFDCDTDLDIPASDEVHEFLSSLGIKMTMAVPGTQLRNGAAVYGNLATKGIEFMNHGFLPHTKWEGGQYVSTTFYHQMPDADVAADIRNGHEAVMSITGRAPNGFRAPHFGLYQEPRQLALVHSTARELGYRYCSTTIPAVGHRHGPAFDAGGVIELPTFGSVRAPTTILDSWTYLTDRRDYALGDDYAELVIETVDTMLAEEIPGLLSWYGDPCHVVGQEPFLRAMRHIAAKGVPSLSGSEAAAMAGTGH
jgi:peptidoglycan/xylan/chitin deacetylase (PgdA/CDA1 family)